MSKSFHAVIEALANPELDYRSIVYRIAEHHPKIVVDAINGSARPESELERECRALLSSGRVIDAIKLYRAETGLGLREAKDAIDKMRGVPA